MLAMMAMAVMSESHQYEHANVSTADIQPRPPKGTREYFFNKYGEFSTEEMLKSECVFMCYSINDKNAIKKFGRWQRENTTGNPLKN